MEEPQAAFAIECGLSSATSDLYGSISPFSKPLHVAYNTMLQQAICQVQGGKINAWHACMAL